VVNSPDPIRSSRAEPLLPNPSSARRKPSFWQSLRIALHGVAHVLRTERNAQIEGVIALIAISLGLFLRITTVEWAIVFVLIGAVLSLEILNTAIEAVVDLTTDHYHELAKIAKDAAAGAVLIMAISSVAIGMTIFGPRLWQVLILFLTS
jgi:diacylglycerol kinase